MIVPNKAIRLEESALSRASVILRVEMPISLGELYEDVSDEFDSPQQFMLALDLLFVLGKINLNMDTGIVADAA
jgi:hypothetical protein